jgi:hypothetical protein
MTAKEKAGIITVRLGGSYVDELDHLCLKTFRTRAKQLQHLIAVGRLVVDLEQQLVAVGSMRAEREAQG